MKRPPNALGDRRLALVAVLISGYLAVARNGVHVYPFSTFDMYASRGPREAARSPESGSGSRLLARSADGQVSEIDRYRAWVCERPLDVTGGAACARRGSYTSIDYKDQEAIDYIATHGGSDPAASDVDVIRRIFWLSEGLDPPRIEDCVLGRCRAVPR